MKKYISLFAGVGGLDIAGSEYGETVAFVEWEEFPMMVLKKRFKNAEFHGNIDTFDGTKYAGTIDIVFGGFPCQPFSVAGKQTGTADHRYKWPQMLRVIQEVGPRWVIAENVFGLLNWNNGMVLDTVLTDLENAGYETLPPFVLPAAAVNAPHRRDRVWIVAYSDSFRRTGRNMQQRNKHNGLHGTEDRQSDSKGNDSNTPRTNTTEQFTGCCGAEFTADTTGERFQRWQIRRKYKRYIRFKRFGKTPNATHTHRLRLRRKINRIRKSRIINQPLPSGNWQYFPTQSPICDGNDGVRARLVRYLRRSGTGLFTEKEIDAIVQKTISRVRKDAIKAGGNAVVWQLAKQIFNVIERIDNEYNSISIRSAGNISKTAKN